jgi:hypothetical protein
MMHYDDYDTYDDDLADSEFGGPVGDFFKGVGKGVAKIGKGAVDLVGKGVKATGKLASDVAGELGKIPVVGPALGATFTLGIGGPFQVAGDIASGKRIDKVALNHLKRQVKAVKAVGPYVQTVISFVPGVGQGISAGIGAGLALADGRPIDQAIIEGVKGAIPGGPLAAAAIDVGVAAMEGKPIEEVAIQAMPLPKSFKDGATSTMRIAKDLANGKRFDKALVNEAVSYLPPEGKKAYRIAAKGIKDPKRLGEIAVDEAIKQLPTAGRKAIVTGMALGEGKKLQALKARAIKSTGFKQSLLNFGRGRARHNKVFGAAAALAAQSTTRLARAGRGRVSASTRGRGRAGRYKKVRPSPKPKMTRAQVSAGIKKILAKQRAGKRLNSLEKLVLKTYKKKLKQTKSKRKSQSAVAKSIKLYAKKISRIKSGKWPRKKKLPPKRAAKRSKRGFLLGLGLMGHRGVSRGVINAVRAQTKGAEKRGFDMALAAQVGMTSKRKAPKLLTPKEKAGYYITRGMAGARPTQKVGMMKALASDFESKSGATVAVQQFLDQRRPWYKKVWGWVTGK